MSFPWYTTVVLVLATASLAAAPALGQAPFDGVWNATVLTKAGSCEPSALYPLTVIDGKVSAAGADVSGTVGKEGNVKASIRGAYANGQLSGNGGSGRWSGASNGVACSGHWEASRQ
jgi:hypothetical protein